MLNRWEPSCIVGVCEDCRILSHIVKMKCLHNLCYWVRGKTRLGMCGCFARYRCLGKVWRTKSVGPCLGWELSHVARVRGVSCLKGPPLPEETTLKAASKSSRGRQPRKKMEERREHVLQYSAVLSHVWLFLVFPPIARRPSLAGWFCESINAFGDKEPLPIKPPRQSVYAHGSERAGLGKGRPAPCEGAGGPVVNSPLPPLHLLSSARSPTARHEIRSRCNRLEQIIGVTRIVVSKVLFKKYSYFQLQT